MTILPAVHGTENVMSEDHVGDVQYQQERKRLAAIDAHIGARIRLQRNIAGMTASALADVLGVRYQQINLYETGKSRISAGNIYLIAEALDIPVSFFFDGMSEDNPIGHTVLPTDKAHEQETINVFSVVDIKAVEDEVRAIAQIYYLIEKSSLRKGIIEFLKIVGREM